MSTFPFGSVPVVTVRSAATVNAKALLSVAGEAALSATCTVKLKVPVAPGVPLTTPLAASSETPAGSAPAVIAQR